MRSSGDDTMIAAVADASEDERAPGERIPRHLRRPPLWHALSPVLIVVAMVMSFVSLDGGVRLVPAILIVVALVQLCVLLVRRWRLAPEGARKL